VNGQLNMQQVFGSGTITSRANHGILICDPLRLREFLKGKDRQRDLTKIFFTDEKEDVYSEGIAVPFFDYSRETCAVTVRDSRAKSGLKGKCNKLSDGWILGTKTGELVMCGVDSLLFWDPYEVNEDPQRYYQFSVPPGWYEVAVYLADDCDGKDFWED